MIQPGHAYRPPNVLLQHVLRVRYGMIAHYVSIIVIRKNGAPPWPRAHLAKNVRVQLRADVFVQMGFRWTGTTKHDAFPSLSAVHVGVWEKNGASASQHVR